MAMLEFLKGNSVTEFNTGLPAKRDQRMYLATKISPILTIIMSKLATHQPSNVVEYICNELQMMINDNCCFDIDPSAALDKIDNLPKPVKDSKRPFSSRGMLGEAVAYDRSRITTSEIERPGTAPQSDRKACLVQQDAVQITEDVSARPITAPQPQLQPEIAPKTIQIGMFGTGNAGKTSIINALQGNFDGYVKPTLGFRPTTMMLGDSTAIKFYDLGGGKKIRDIWNEYYHDVHAVIFVLDSSLDANSADWEDTKNVFNTVSNHLVLNGKPILIAANKSDHEQAQTLESICESLKINTGRNCNVISCTTKPTSPTVESQIDKNLEMGLEWLLTSVNNSYETLNNRVVADTKNKAQQEAKKRLERERKVLRNKIASAFFNDLQDEKKPADLEPASKEEIYDPEVGIKFLADEIGASMESLSPEAIQIAELIGYQRLALQIIGALFSPINKKKVPMSWPEIKDMVVELRGELGL
jgi:small GTP-binding protein